MDLTARRRGLNGSKAASVLPDEYRKVRYIESPGFCWFDTAFKLTENDEITSDIVFQLSNSSGNWVAGNIANSLNYQNEYGWTSSWWTGGGRITYEYLTTIETAKLRKVHAYAQDAISRNTITYSWRVFGRSGARPSAGDTPACKIWSHSVSINGEKVLDLIPCYRKSDGEVGMYDLVTGTFYTNQGTGEGFTYG